MSLDPGEVDPYSLSGSGGSSLAPGEVDPYSYGSVGSSLAPEEADPYSYTSGGSSLAPGQSHLAEPSDPPDAFSVVQVAGGKKVYRGGGFEKAEVEAFVEEKQAAGEVTIASIDPGCLSDIDCFPGFMCVFPQGSEEGSCVPRGDVGVRIVGVIDSKTCPYCLSMIGITGTLDSVPIPPYHKHCRCSFEYLT